MKNILQKIIINNNNNNNNCRNNLGLSLHKQTKIKKFKKFKN